MEQLHRLAQRLVAPDPLLLDLAQPFLVALQRRLDRLEQRLQLLLALLAGLVEAGVGALEELLLRLGEQFGADLVELGAQLLLGLHQLPDPRLEIARVGLKPGKLAHRLVALAPDLGDRHPQGVACPGALFGERAGASAPHQPAERHADRQRRDRQQHGQERIHRTFPTGTKSEPRAGAVPAQAKRLEQLDRSCG